MSKSKHVTGTPKKNTKPYACYSSHPDGYMRWTSEDDCVYIHQLLAIANGADPHHVFDPSGLVMHLNGIQWDNRKENLELTTRKERMEAAHKLGDIDYNNEQKYTDKELIEWLELFVTEFGFVPTSKDIVGWPGPSNTTYRNRFGSFANALRKAGFTPRGESDE